MIDDASDYQYVSPVGLIDGGILPARDIAADGSALALRAEDLDFALEAANERTLWTNPYVSPVTLPNPTLVFSPALFEQPWLQLKQSAYCDNQHLPDEGYADIAMISCIDPDYVFTDKAPWESNTDEPLTAMYPDCRIFSNYTPAGGGRVLDLSYLRRYYYDLTRADRLLVYSCKANGALSGTDNRGRAVSRSYTDSGFGASTPSFDCGIRYNSAGRYTYGCESANITATPPLPGRVRSAQAVVVYWVTATWHGTAHHYRYTVVHQCGVSATSLSIPAAAFVLDPMSIAAAMGYNYPAADPDDGTAYRFSVQPRYFHIIIAYTFRTEIRSLNWQWQPPI